MQKYLKLLMVVLLATVSFTLTSCGDDDDDTLIGTWETSYTQDGWSYRNTIAFSAEGSFVITETASGDGVVFEEYVAGIYSVEGDVKDGAVVTLTGFDTDDVDAASVKIAVRIKGDKLHVTDEKGGNLVFTRR